MKSTVGITAAIVAVILLAITSSTAEAKKRHKTKPVPITHTIKVDFNTFDGNGNKTIPFMQDFSSKRHHHRYASRGGGSCDGFHRCRCGVVAAGQAGLPLNYQGRNLKLAASWYSFPRTSCHAGAVGIPHAHHVYTVMQCNGDGTALVHDDAGTYTRRIAGNTFVSPTGGGGERVYAARSHRRHRHQQITYHYQPQDRYSAY